MEGDRCKWAKGRILYPRLKGAMSPKRLARTKYLRVNRSYFGIATLTVLIGENPP